MTSTGVTLEDFQRVLGRRSEAEDIEAVKRRVPHLLEIRYQEPPEIFWRRSGRLALSDAAPKT
jgi:hypothetical protein